MSLPHATPLRRRQSSAFDPANTNANGASGASAPHEDALAQSLRQLSLSARSPSAASTRRSSTTPRSPVVAAAAAAAAANGRSSRAGTPAMLRKTSMSSLHSSSTAANHGSSNGSSSPAKTGLSRRTSAANLKASSPATPLPLRSPRLGGEEPPRRQSVRPPPPTAADIARTHFQGELARHQTLASASAAAAAPQTIVVLHDACYGHRFSRPRTSRANLSTIVERPERVQACAVGVSAAYVRLGGRHVDGDYMPHPQLDAAAIPAAAVPFRLHKTARALPLLAPAVTNVHGVKWMEELKMMCDAAEAKLALNGRELQRPDMDRGPADHHGHGHGHGAVPPRLHEGDLYLCAESLQALEGALGGVCEAVDAVFARSPAAPRRAFVAIRPPGHHCSSDWPSGFCWINNVHIGIMHGILTHGLTHAAIVDFDLHHGDGSQAIAWAHNTRSATATKNAAAWKKTSIGYFSLHDINSFPCEAGDEDKVKNASLCIENAHGQTVWNVHLEPWKTEAAFWALYSRKYAVLLEKLRAFLRSQAEQRAAAASANANSPVPCGAIFISAGFDASEWETSSMQRHKVNVPTEFYARFTRDVAQIADEECAGRVISVLEGGYSDRALISGVLSHVSGLAGADPLVTPSARDEAAYHSGLGYEMGSRRDSDGIHAQAPSSAAAAAPDTTATPYDPAWWTSGELDRIEAAIAPPPPALEPKPDRIPHPATTYSSPTQSSQAKTATPRVRRSMSGLSTAYGGGSSSAASSPISRPPSPPPPPPPEVPWTVAMHELSKLLIPTDRSTTSCTMEDLSAEATRARRDRQMLLVVGSNGTGAGGLDPALSSSSSASTPATPNAPTRVSLRERKQVRPFGSSVMSATSAAIKEEDDHERGHELLDRKNRRKTVAGVASTATTPAAARTNTAKPRASTGRRLSASAATAVLPKEEVPDVPPLLQPLNNNRPASAHSSTTTATTTGTTRPGSSMSVATTAGGGSGGAPVAVPKMRQPSGAVSKTPLGKTATGKTPLGKTPGGKTPGGRSPRKKAAAPVPAPPRLRRNSSSSSSNANNANNANNSTSGGASDVDVLTSGMRKIKINVVTAAQKEARARAKREEKENQPAGEAKQASELGRAVLPQLPATPLAQTVRLPTAGSSPVDITAADVESLLDSRTALLTPSTEAATVAAASVDSPTPASFVSAASAAAPTVFIPYEPDGLDEPDHDWAAATSPPVPRLQWLPPNQIDTPAVERTPPMMVAAPGVSGAPGSMPATPSLMKRADLPVFTATSAIPFAPSSRPSSSSGAGLPASKAGEP